MGVVVADTCPLHYLVLIDAIDLLPRLFGTVLLPAIVQAELSHPHAPAPVRNWLATRPARLEVRPTPPAAALPFPRIGMGERATIDLAQAVDFSMSLRRMPGYPLGMTFVGRLPPPLPRPPHAARQERLGVRPGSLQERLA